MAEKQQVEATRVARAVSVGGKVHRLEVVLESDRTGDARYTIDGVKVSPADWDRVIRLATVAEVAP